MAKKSFAAYASDKTWDSTGFESLGEGDYIGRVSKTEIKQSKNNDWMMLAHLKVAEGDDEGKLGFFVGMFEKDGNWNPYAPKAFFAALGLELPEFEDMEDELENLVEEEIHVAFTVTEKNGFTNLEVTEIVEGYESDDSDGDSDGDEDDSDDAELPTADEVEEMDKEEILETFEDLELEVDGKKTQKKMKAAILEHIEENSDDDDDSEGEDDADSEETEENFDELVEFCASAGIEEVEDMETVEEIVEFMEENIELEETDLTKDEIKLLNDVELGGIINEKKPAKKSAKKKTSKKADKKTTKKADKKPAKKKSKK